MARHTAQPFRAIQVVILAIGGCLLSLAIANATTVSPDRLIQRGYGELDAGQFSSALQTWQQAEQIYRRQRNPIGIAGSLINQSLAQRAIGQNLSACYNATAALAVDQQICRGQGSVVNLVPRSPQSITILGLNTLGDCLRAPRLIDFGLIAVLNKTVYGEAMTMAGDDGRIIVTGIENWTHLSGDCGRFYGPRLQPGEPDQVVSQILQT